MRPALLLALVLAACTPPADDRPLDVSVIGPRPRLADRARPTTAPAAALAGATAQGLVAYDAAGQIEPALAERWIVSDGGLSLIFRLADVAWLDGTPVEAGEIARRMRAAIGPASRNPLKPITGAIDEIVAVTPQVIDVRLSAPRPNLLQLFAQPEFAMLRAGTGSGPFMPRLSAGVWLLTPRPPADADATGPKLPVRPTVRLRGERAALAVARFAGGESDGVLGGRFADLPIARAATLPGTALRFDPAPGLFGLMFAAAPGFTADPVIRRALAMAVDRDALLDTFAVPGWQAETRLVGGPVADLPVTATPDWAALPLGDRRAAARAVVAAWTAAHGTTPVLRIALPPGPGSRLLFTRLALDWRAIGVVSVPAIGPADLRLIDDVAPGEIASWYLRRFACVEGVPCTAQADRLLIAARNASTLAERAVLLREADQLITATTPFIALARPLRWSLVGPRLTGWRESPRAIHPLNHLRVER